MFDLKRICDIHLRIFLIKVSLYIIRYSCYYFMYVMCNVNITAIILLNKLFQLNHLLILNINEHMYNVEKSTFSIQVSLFSL